ncbi:MAG: nickel insertion protein [Eubacterium sp.]
MSTAMRNMTMNTNMNTGIIMSTSITTTSMNIITTTSTTITTIIMSIADFRRFLKIRSRQSEMTEKAKETATLIFDILADAESKAHGVPRTEVHFHEVGAIDSIVDIVAVAVCLDNLGIREVLVPVLYEGCGYIRCQHGVIPVPVPATLILLRLIS